MIAYEVNLYLKRVIAHEFRAWLDAHVVDILGLPGFAGAEVAETLEPAARADEIALCVRYRLVDEAALAAYLCDHAPRLREEGIARFGAAFRAERRVLRIVAGY